MLDDAQEEKANGEKVRIGQVVCWIGKVPRTQRANFAQVIRGNSVVMLEALERMGGGGGGGDYHQR